VKVVKATFEEEQLPKEEDWLKLTGEERLAWAFKVRERARKKG
jgi:hypothetical protein